MCKDRHFVSVTDRAPFYLANRPMKPLPAFHAGLPTQAGSYCAIPLSMPLRPLLAVRRIGLHGEAGAFSEWQVFKIRSSATDIILRHAGRGALCNGQRICVCHRLPHLSIFSITEPTFRTEPLAIFGRLPGRDSFATDNH